MEKDYILQHAQYLDRPAHFKILRITYGIAREQCMGLSIDLDLLPPPQLTQVYDIVKSRIDELSHPRIE